MKVLIVSPHFPPTNAADMQRVRMLLPYLQGAGVDAEVLAVEPEQVAAPVDPWLSEGLPPSVPVHRVKALSLAWSRVPGLGILTYRAQRALERRGQALLAAGGFGLVYFSTTQFGIHALGPRWKQRLGVPFVMDYQDPWVNDYYQQHPEVTPPGGRLKFALAYALSRRAEPRVLRHCAGFTSVSKAYPQQLMARYQGRCLTREGESDYLELGALNHRLWARVLPFPGDDQDLQRARTAAPARPAATSPPDTRHWVYIGRGGKDMAKSVRSLFRALVQTPNLPPVRLHFIGTSYAAAGAGTQTIQDEAEACGVGHLVEESPDRIPYAEALRRMWAADALIVPGSDDPGYTASKIYPYLLAERPLLAIFHAQSSVVELIERVKGGSVVAFQSEEPETAIAARIQSLLEAHGGVPHIPLDHAAFAPHHARTQAATLKAFFEQCCTAPPRLK